MHSDPEHRSLNLFDELGNPRQRLSSVLHSFTVFPEDERSREQALAVYGIEERAYRSDPETYCPSRLSQVLLTNLQRSAGQRFVAGLTTLAFVVLAEETSEPVSLYKASKTVEQALALARTDDERPLKLVSFENGQPMLRGVAAPNDQRGVTRAANVHQSVSHILAADLLATNSLEFLPIFERTFEMDAVLLNTASIIEKVMLARAPDYFRNPWLVTPCLPTGLRDYGAVPLNGGFVDFLRSGI